MPSRFRQGTSHVTGRPVPLPGRAADWTHNGSICLSPQSADMASATAHSGGSRSTPATCGVTSGDGPRSWSLWPAAVSGARVIKRAARHGDVGDDVALALRLSPRRAVVLKGCSRGGNSSPGRVHVGRSARETGSTPGRLHCVADRSRRGQGRASGCHHRPCAPGSVRRSPSRPAVVRPLNPSPARLTQSCSLTAQGSAAAGRMPMGGASRRP
jgi:hypothetical protein